MENIFLDTNYTSFEQSIIKAVIFIAISALLLYLIQFILTKLLFKKSEQRKEINIKLAFLWSMVIYILLFNVYWYFLVFLNGVDAFNWSTPSFYLGILAQILIFVGVVVYFFIKSAALTKIINDKSIN